MATAGKILTPGAGLTVVDLAALEEFDVSGMTPGTQVYVQSELAYYNIVLDNTGLPILGISGATWHIVDTGGGDVVSVDSGNSNISVDATDPANPLVAFVPCDYEHERYVHPSGTNATGFGSLERPFKTRSYAFDDLPAEGGVVHVAPETQWSDGLEGLGLTAGQGCWITGQPSSVLPPGFLPQKTVRFINHGVNYFGQFGIACAHVYGGKINDSTTRDDPCVWLVGTTVPTEFYGLHINGDQPVRRWDYRRNEDLTINQTTITNASRASGYTVLTLTPPLDPITTMQRTGTTVRVSFASNSYPIPRQLMQIRIDSGSASGTFPSGDYVCTDSGGSGHSWWFEYTEGSGNAGPVSPVGATYQTHGVIVADETQYTEIEIHSSNAQFPSTMYTASDVISPVSIQVEDRYGFGSRSATVSAASIGTMRLQLRYISAMLDTFDGCAVMTSFGGGEKFGQGPTFDYGDIAAGDWSWIRRCFMEGSMPEGSYTLAEVDPARSANFFGLGKSGVNINITDCQIQAGNFFIPIVGGSGGPGQMQFSHVTQDVAQGHEIFPLIQFRFGVAHTVEIVACDNADASNGRVSVDTGQAGGGIWVDGAEVTSNRATEYLAPPVYRQARGSLPQGQTRSIQSLRGVGWEGTDGRIAGRRPDSGWAGGVYQSPLVNMLPQDLSDGAIWVPSGGATVTAGIADPFGGTGAYRLSAGGGSITIDEADLLGPSIAASALGDCMDIGMWIRPVGGNPLPSAAPLVAGTYHTGTSYAPITWYYPFKGDGSWQWITFFGKRCVAAEVGCTTFDLTITGAAGYAVDYYLPTLFFLPGSDWYENGQAEQAQVMRGHPSYLSPGIAGTQEGVPLVGHGGIGSETLVVGGASGQITVGASLGVAIQIVDATGAVIGVVVPNAFTVNP